MALRIQKNDGFVKVFKDDKLIMNYNGITFDWSGSYYASYIRLGIYRDSDPSGAGYPDQVAHFDDFIVVSDKKLRQIFGLKGRSVARCPIPRLLKLTKLIKQQVRNFR